MDRIARLRRARNFEEAEFGIERRASEIARIETDHGSNEDGHRQSSALFSAIERQVSAQSASPADWLPSFSLRRPEQKTSDVDASSCRGRSSTAASTSCSTSLPAPVRALPSYPVPMRSPR